METSLQLSKTEIQDRIAKRVAQELANNTLVNLGIGLPTKVSNFISKDSGIIFQSENGFVGLGSARNETDLSGVVNAGGIPVSVIEGAAFFDSSTSFGIIRGGHVDVTVLGALQVDERGSIANYLIPGKMVPGMGGAMDLLVGAKKVIVAMEHTNKGKPKILRKCSLPLTAKEMVDTIITEAGVFDVTEEGIKVREVSEGYSLESIQQMTECQLLY